MAWVLKWTPRGVLFVGLLGGLWATFVFLAPTPATLHGQSVPSDPDLLESWGRFYARRWGEETVSLQCDEEIVASSRSRLGVSIDPQTLRARLRQARFERLFQPSSVILGEALRLDWPVLTNNDTIYQVVDALRHDVDIHPSPHLLGPDGQAIGGTAGAALDRETAVAVVVSLLEDGAVFIRLQTSIVPPPSPVLQAASAATYDTILVDRTSRFNRRSGRGHNIQRAALQLDGAVVPPGVSLSFNALVGERRLDRGFAMGPEIRGGEVVDGVGGGICMVATELYRASLEAGLVIEQHHSHSRRVRYGPLGLDAAVVWNSKDLVVRNDTAVHLRLRASTNRGRLRIAWEGPYRLPSVDVTTQIVEGSRRNTNARAVVAVRRTWPDTGRTENWTVGYPAMNGGSK